MPTIDERIIGYTVGIDLDDNRLMYKGEDISDVCFERKETALRVAEEVLLEKLQYLNYPGRFRPNLKFGQRVAFKVSSHTLERKDDEFILKVQFTYSVYERVNTPSTVIVDGKEYSRTDSHETCVKENIPVLEIKRGSFPFYNPSEGPEECEYYMSVRPKYVRVYVED